MSWSRPTRPNARESHDRAHDARPFAVAGSAAGHWRCSPPADCARYRGFTDRVRRCPAERDRGRSLHGEGAHRRRDRPPRRQPAPALLREIAQLPEVEDASVVAPTLASPENSGGYYPFLQSTDGKAGFTLQRGVLVSGRQADPDAADEVVLSEAHARGLGKHVGDTLVMRGFTPEEQQRCLFADDYDPSCDAVFASPGGPTIVTLRVVGVARTGSDLRNRTNEISLSFLTPAFYERYGAELAVARTHACDPAARSLPCRCVQCRGRSRVAGRHRSQLRGPERESGRRLGPGPHRRARPVRPRCRAGSRRRGRSGGRPPGSRVRR